MGKVLASARKISFLSNPAITQKNVTDMGRADRERNLNLRSKITVELFLKNR
jgi:hypothetical protein